MRHLIEDIMRGRRNDGATLPLRMLLRVLAVLFGIVVFWRNFLYNRRILTARQVPCRVVCVGNLTVGGTGKTPVVLMVAGMLRDRGVKVVVVSRGYGRGSAGPLVISDGREILPPDLSGDEPHLIASRLTDVPVVVGRDRHRAAMLAHERFNPEVIILDDGFQHRRLYRDIDIVTVDADHPIGSEHLLPRGLLRESPYGLGRARAVMVTRLDNGHDRARIERIIRFYNRDVTVFWSRMVADGLRDPLTGRTDGLAAISGMPVAALSNVANPGSFYRLLEADYARIVLRRAMPDHHRYTAGEIAGIAAEASRAGARYLVMTAKDERNLPPDVVVKEVPLRVLDIDAVLDGDGDVLLELILPHDRKRETT